MAKEIADAPSGLARLLVLRRLAPTEGRAVRFVGPAFWAAFGRVPVDVVFLDASRRVLAVFEALRPWAATGAVARAREGVLLAAGACARVPVRVGDALEFTPLTSERIAAGAKPPEGFG